MKATGVASPIVHTYSRGPKTRSGSKEWGHWYKKDAATNMYKISALSID